MSEKTNPSPKPNEPNMQEAVAVPPTKKANTSDEEGFYEEPLFEATQQPSAKITDIKKTQTNRDDTIAAFHINVDTNQQIHQELIERLKTWDSQWLTMIGWFLGTIALITIFAMVLKNLEFIYGLGLIFGLIVPILYFLPNSRTHKRVTIIMAVLVIAFVSSFICAFATLIFSFGDYTVLACGIMSFLNGGFAAFIFRNNIGIIDAFEKIESMS